MKNKINVWNEGRKPFFKTPEEFAEKATEYIQQAIENGDWLTITGLALYLGFESRQSFYDYEKREGFSYTVKRCRMFIENDYEMSLRNIKSATGAIFALKNLGWEDKTTVKNDSPQLVVNTQNPDAVHSLKQNLENE